MSSIQFVLTASSIVAIVIVAGSFGLLTGQESLPAANADDFWTHITETESYRDWEPWPGHAGFMPGNSPHGAFLKLYVNEPAMMALEAGTPLPSGAIVVKENYGPERALAAVTPMYRVANYNPEGGDWFWAKYGKNGDVEASGKVQSCIDCHSAAEGDDWHFTEAAGSS